MLSGFLFKNESHTPTENGQCLTLGSKITVFQRLPLVFREYLEDNSWLLFSESLSIWRTIDENKIGINYKTLEDEFADSGISMDDEVSFHIDIIFVNISVKEDFFVCGLCLSVTQTWCVQLLAK